MLWRKLGNKGEDAHSCKFTFLFKLKSALKYDVIYIPKMRISTEMAGTDFFLNIAKVFNYHIVFSSIRVYTCNIANVCALSVYLWKTDLHNFLCKGHIIWNHEGQNVNEYFFPLFESLNFKMQALRVKEPHLICPLPPFCCCTGEQQVASLSLNFCDLLYLWSPRKIC